MKIIQSLVILLLCGLNVNFADKVNDTCSSCERLANLELAEECKYETSCEDCQCGDPTNRPHIILIVADDLGWNDNGFHGSCELKSPNLDALFYSGVVLNRMYTQPVCSPSRSALMTSIYPYKNGMSGTVLVGSKPYGLPLENKLLSNYMKDMCYKTHIVGKWHLGHYKKDYWPLSRGFDCAMGFLGSHQSYNYGWMEDGVSKYIAVARRPETVGGFDIRKQNRMAYENVGKNQVDLYDDEVLRIIRLHNSSCPLFLYFAHPAPHSESTANPYPAKDQYLQQLSNVTDINRRKLGGLVLSLDNSIGKLVTALDQTDMLDNSIIFFLSDNGADMIEPAVGSAYPLRGAKHSLWEGGIRSSSVVWSRNITGGRLINDRFHIVDVGPTLVRAAGGTCKSENFKNSDGIDQWETIINNKPSPRSEIALDADVLGTAAVTFKMADKWFKCTKGPQTLGLADYWYGNDGGNCTYDIGAILNSPVYKALNAGASPQDMLQLRSELTVRCNDTDNENPSVTECRFDRPPFLCLFDIENDPCEKYDTSAEYPEAVSKCLQLIAKANSEAAPPRTKPYDHRGDPKNWCNEWTNYGDCLGME